MVERRDFLKAASFSAMSVALASSRQASLAAPLAMDRANTADRPNILIIISDEHRAGLTKRSGYPLDTSPMLDSLASEGVAFDGAYCTAPLCVPSRTSILTGRWPEAHRVRQNSQPEVAFFEKDLFDVVKSKGYKTGLIGKNHTYMTEKMHDVWMPYSHESGWIPPNAPKEYAEYDKWLRRLGLHGVSTVPTPFPLEIQYPYRIVSDTIEYLDKLEGENFALEVSFPEPHNPIQVPKPYFDMYPPDQVPPRGAGPEALKFRGFRHHWMHGLEEDTYPGYDKEWRRYKSDYLGMLRLLDDQLARLVNYLKQKGLYENTIIVYVADHGDFLMDYGLEGKGVGMSEALMRVPMVWSGGPVHARNEHHPALVSNADIMPTFCEAIGAEIPHGVQGRSLWPLLQGKDYSQEEFRSVYGGAGFGGLYYDASDNVPYSVAQMAVGEGARRKPLAPGQPKTYDTLNKVGQSGYMKMVRMGDWKLIYDMMGYGELYHLPSDPYELKNLFGNPSVKDEQMRLLAELLAWTIRAEDTLPTGAYETKWPKEHNWYSPYRHGESPEGFIP
jgi:arylsulfatase A-like enzyme